MGEGALRALKVAVVVMGVLIVGGTALLGIVIAQRMSGAPRPAASGAASAADAAASNNIGIRLTEPPGTHVVGASLAGDRMALTLEGGGPDRVVVLDLRSGRVMARVSLAP